MNTGWVKVRKKPVIVDAISVEKENIILIKEIPTVEKLNFDDDIRGEIRTKEGTHKFTGSDLIICGINGEYYPIKRHVFEETYEIED